MTNLITQVHLKLTVQLESRMRDMEAATECTLFLPKDSDIVKEMLSIGRHYSNMIENHPEQERGSPHTWFFNSMVKATTACLTKSWILILLFCPSCVCMGSSSGMKGGCPVRSASRTRKSTAWEPGKGAQQRDHARQRQVKGRKGRKGDAPTDSVPVVPDGSVSALTQMLLRRWRDRRQSVSEPTRSKRESETIASLIRTNQVA